jgi:hypothetical protein
MHPAFVIDPFIDIRHADERPESQQQNDESVHIHKNNQFP